MGYHNFTYTPSGGWRNEWARDPDGYKVVEWVEGPGGDWTGESAAILQTDDDKFWAAHQPGGCSCVTGESPNDIDGPYETYAEALGMIPDTCSSLFERRT